jgi:hypothetical protein
MTDTLALAELLRSTLLAYLTPEEAQERKAIGFTNSEVA